MTTTSTNKTELMILKLKEIQLKLSNFEDNYDSKFDHLEKRSKINHELDDKTTELAEIQKSLITINVGDDEIITSKQLINNCKFTNILQDMIVESSKLFIDVPSNYFKRILFIMRNKTSVSNGKKLKLELTEKMTADMMTSVIKLVFKGEDVLKEVMFTTRSEKGGNVMDYLYKKPVPEVVIPINNNYNYNNANYNNANYNAQYNNNGYNDY